MTVTAVHKDLDACTLTVSAEFDHPVERVWQLWADPRQLERWWGPPMWPATFTAHSLAVGEMCRYHMTGPDGEQSHGWWRVRTVDAPVLLEVEDGFAGPDGEPNPAMPTTGMQVTLAPRAGGGTSVAIVSTFASTDDLVRMAEMGMEEGLKLAMGQMDAILAE